MPGLFVTLPRIIVVDSLVLQFFFQEPTAKTKRKKILIEVKDILFSFLHCFLKR